MIEMSELNSKKFLALLEKYKKSDDKESFKSEYCDTFPIVIKYSKPDDIESCAVENLTAEIDREIILDLIWINKLGILKKGLREEKLKRIFRYL